MNVSSASDFSNSIALQAISLKSGKVQQEIGAAVLKQVLDQQQSAGQAVVEMIKNTSSQNGLGTHVDIRA